MKPMELLRAVRLEKERVAVSLLSLSFFVVLYTLAALSSPVGWRPAFLGLALCYVVAFLGLASQWFWARWYASGLAWSGATLGLVSLVMLGWNPILVAYGGLHALVLCLLAGPHVAGRFEMQAAWRERYAMDEFAVARLGRVITRASAALPSLIVWALAPREGQGLGLASGLAAACVLVGLLGILRLRTWGVLALGLAAVFSLTATVTLDPSSLNRLAWVGSWADLPQPAAAFSSILLLAAIVPLVGALRCAWRSLP